MKDAAHRLGAAVVVAIVALMAMPQGVSSQIGARLPSPVSAEEAREIAVEAYIYAYPLVLSELTRRISMGNARRAPINQFTHRRAFPDASFTAVVRPNADTLYSALWFDVSKEPLVIGVPDSGGRYYVLQMLDMWTDVFAAPGSRTTGTGSRLIVLADAGWRGSLPPGATLIHSPTSMGWIIGRTQTNDPSDYENVHRFQAGLTATPLGSLGKPYTAPKSVVDPAWDLKTPPVDRIERMSAQEFFELFVELTTLNPPHANDYPIVHRMARIGVEPGKPFSLATAPPETRRALEAAASPALKLIRAGRGDLGVRQNGWRTYLSAIGTYGTDYRARATIAYGGLGANPIEDAVYPTAATDSDGNPMSSENRYVVHFSKDQLPPVRAFWSLTVYDRRQLFAANPISRYAIGDRDKLAFNADGSLDLYLQRTSPGADRAPNWLPTPASGPFTLTLRLYWPTADVLNGTWAPPRVKKVD